MEYSQTSSTKLPLTPSKAGLTRWEKRTRGKSHPAGTILIGTKRFFFLHLNLSSLFFLVELYAGIRKALSDMAGPFNWRQFLFVFFSPSLEADTVNWAVGS